MSVPVLLLTSMLIAAPPAEPVPVPRWEKGQEIVWRGTFSEAILRPNVRAFRNYEAETRLFVLDISDHGADVALFTSIKLKPDTPPATEPPPVVRIELARLEPGGQIRLLDPNQMIQKPDQRQPGPLPAPVLLEGLPLFEIGMLSAIPGERINFGQTWNVPDSNRPGLRYRLEGTDSVRGLRCLKITAVQQSEDWEKPIPNRPGWRRGDTLSVAPKLGYAARYERTIEKQDPQTGELGFRSKLNYEQISMMRYPDRLGDDRRQEAIAAAGFVTDFEQAVNDPRRADARPFDQLKRAIDQHLTMHFNGEATPYREATLAIKRKNDLARQGHIAPRVPAVEPAPNNAKLVRGQPAPDVPAMNVTTRETQRLSALTDRPTLLLYYQPDSIRTAEPLLRFAQLLHDRHAGRARILPVAVGTSEAATRQREQLKLTVPVLAGRSMYQVHGIDSTPAFVLINASGKVEEVTLGWSEENVQSVSAGLAKMLK